MQKSLVRGLAVIILIALLAAGFNAYKRVQQENDNRGLEMAVVYREAEYLAVLAGDGDTESLLRELKSRGVTTVLFKEDTPGILEDRGEFHIGTGVELSEAYRLERELPEQEYNPGYTYLVTGDKKAWERVAAGMESKEMPYYAGELGGGTGQYVIATSLPVAVLESEGMGFPLEKMKQIAAGGFNIMVQPRTWHGVNLDQLQAVFEPFYELKSSISGVLFNDSQLPGYVADSKDRKMYLRSLGEEIEKLGAPLVAIEFEDQKGFGSVARAMDKQVVRLHTIPRDEMRDYGVGGAVDRYELAATDRNIRVMLVRFLTGTEHPGLIDKNLGFFDKLQHTLVAGNGFQPGQASVLGPLNVSRWSILFIGLGIVAGGMLLALRLFPYRWALALGALGFLGWAAVMGATLKDTSLLLTARQLMALAGLIIFPTLAIMWGIREQGLPAAGVLLRFIQLSLVSLVGAILMVGLFADAGFMLKLEQFRGVKAALGMPLLLVAAYYFFAVPAGEGWKEKIIRAAKCPVTVGLAAVAAVVGVMLLLYMTRTGNAGAMLPFEQAFRGFLEEVLSVRPRTKEFLLGHPLLLLLLYTGYRDIRFMPLLILGAIGQVSMVNTFAHIHTPLVISLLRSFNGLWLGILGGLVLIAAWYAIARYGKRWLK